LLQARTRERWLRRALWLWCAVLLVWLLPIGAWTAPGLAPVPTILIGTLLVAVGAVLVWLHQRVSRADTVRAAMDAAFETAGLRQDGIVDLDEPVPARRAVATPLILLIALAWLAPVVAELADVGLLSGWLWLVYPLAGLLVSARWRWRGAVFIAATGLATFLLVEGPLLDWRDVSDTDTRAFLWMTALLIVAVPLLAGSYAERLAGTDAGRRQAEDELRAVRRAEAALRASEGRFRSLIQNASDIITLVDADGTRRYVSPSVTRVLGFRPEELTGQSFFAGVRSDDTNQVLGHFLAALQGEEPSPRFEFQVQHRTGGWRSFEAVATNLLSDPSVGSVVVVARDITEQKQRESELRASEERFRALVQHASDLIMVADSAGQLRYYSPSVERVLGYRPEDLQGIDFFQLVHAEDQTCARSVIDEVIATSTFHAPVELRCRHVNGTWRTMEIHANNLIDDPRVGGIVITARDVTEHKRTTEQRSFLAEASALFTGSLDLETTARTVPRIAVPFLADFCVVVLIDADGSIGHVATAATGPDRCAQVDDLLRRFLPRLRVPSAVADRLRTVRSVYEPDGLNEWFRGLTANQDAYAALERLGLRSGLIVPLVAHDQTLGLMLLAYAESDRRYGPDDLALSEELARRAALALDNARLYQELDERKQQLQDLVARLFAAQEEERRRVAYEVHDGLAQIAAGAYQHLQAFAALYHPRRPTARAELERVLELTQRTVREARRVVAGLRPTVLDDFGLAAALRLEADGLRAEGWDVTYDDRLSPERLPAMVETALFRVAQEAIVNARKHSGSTRLYISLGRDDQGARLEVRDWGRGMPSAEDLSPAGPGERVGLAGMQERITLLNGRLRIESDTGGGTRVIAEVPMASPVPAAAAPNL
jgi:PAS domain S-box-containing protein